MAPAFHLHPTHQTEQPNTYISYFLTPYVGKTLTALTAGSNAVRSRTVHQVQQLDTSTTIRGYILRYEYTSVGMAYPSAPHHCHYASHRATYENNKRPTAKGTLTIVVPGVPGAGMIPTRQRLFIAGPGPGIPPAVASCESMPHYTGRRLLRSSVVRNRGSLSHEQI